MKNIVHVDDIQAVHVHEPPYDRDIKVLTSPFTQLASVHFSVGVTLIAPGKKHEFHRHEAEEVIYVLAGRGHVKIDGGTCKLISGTVIQLSSNQPHGFVNEGEDILQLLWIMAPPGREKDFLTDSKTKV